MHITPHIVVRGAAEAADFYANAFGAEEASRVPVPGDRIMSLELRLGEATVMLADEFPELGVLSPLSIGGTAVVLTLHTDDADALYARALGAGAESLSAPADAFWGERHAQVRDPFGHKWGIAQHVRDVPHDEVVASATALFGG
jgi:PhnB protein